MIERMQVKTIRPVTTDKTIDDTIKLLTKRSEVTAIVTLGTTATGQLTPDSDYDVLLVLKDHKPNFSVEISIIDGRTADILFVAAEQITLLTLKSVQEFSPPELSISRWLSNGKIIFDRDSKTSKAQEACRLKLSDNTPGQHFLADRAQHLNYDLRVNKTYARSTNPLYLQALRLRELHSFSNLFMGYFALRGVPWEGEKRALKHLQQSDPTFLELITSWLNETDLKQRMEIYSEVAAIVLEPAGGIWPDNRVFEYERVWERLTS